MRDDIQEEALRLERVLCGLRDRFDNLVLECDSLEDSSLVNYAEESYDCLQGCIFALRRLMRET